MPEVWESEEGVEKIINRYSTRVRQEKAALGSVAWYGDNDNNEINLSKN
jgi:hypothetical protein